MTLIITHQHHTIADCQPTKSQLHCPSVPQTSLSTQLATPDATKCMPKQTTPAHNHQVASHNSCSHLAPFPHFSLFFFFSFSLYLLLYTMIQYSRTQHQLTTAIMLWHTTLVITNSCLYWHYQRHRITTNTLLVDRISYIWYATIEIFGKKKNYRLVPLGPTWYWPYQVVLSGTECTLPSGRLATVWFRTWKTQV